MNQKQAPPVPPAPRGGQPGLPALRLLAEGSTTRILRELTGGPLRPIELKQRLPDLAHSALMRRLVKLALRGALTHERVVGLPPRAYYSLAEAGKSLLRIADAAELWERQWSPPPPPGPPGTRALRLLADGRTMAIVHALAEEPLRPTDLERLPGVGRSATRRRLSPLLQANLLTRTDDEGRVHYALTVCARRLRLIAMLAAQWEWHWVSSDPIPL